MPVDNLKFNLHNIAGFVVFAASFLMIADPNSIIYFTFIFFLLAVLQIRKEGLKISPVEGCCGIFLIVLLISFMDASDITRGLEQWFRMLQWIFFPFFIGQFNFSEKTRRLAWIFFGCGLPFYAFKDFMDWQSGDMYYYPRLAGGYAMSQFSIILSFYIIMFCCLLLFDRGRIRSTVIFSVALLTGLVLLVLAGTRGVWISTTMAMGIIVFFRNKKIFFAYVTGLLLLGTVFVNLPDNPYSARLSNLSSCGELLARFESQREAIRLFLTHPVNGIGYENFVDYQNRSAYQIEPFYMHPHNMILKMLCETGIIGLIGYLIFKGGIFITCLKTIKDRLLLSMVTGWLITLEIYELNTIVIRKHYAYAVLFLMLSVVLQKNYRKFEGFGQWFRPIVNKARRWV
jgi:O-antigen ligase